MSKRLYVRRTNMNSFGPPNPAFWAGQWGNRRYIRRLEHYDLTTEVLDEELRSRTPLVNYNPLTQLGATRGRPPAWQGTPFMWAGYFE